MRKQPLAGAEKAEAVMKPSQDTCCVQLPGECAFQLITVQYRFCAVFCFFGHIGIMLLKYQAKNKKG